MMTDANRQVSCLTFTIANYNPNHTIRFVGLDDPIRYLFDLSTAVNDDSFYVAPKFAQDVSLQERHPARTPVNHTASNSGDLHLSLHESGAVNLHVTGTKTRLRSAGEGRGKQGLTLRLVFNSIRLFQPASYEEFNALPKRYTSIPVMGFWEQYPICLDIYQCSRDGPWSMPKLADIFQVHARVQPERKSSDYHFLVWQHSKAERYPTDVAILYSPLPAT